MAYEYLDKLFLIGIYQPTLQEKEIESFYNNLTDGKIYKEKQSDVLKENKTNNDTENQPSESEKEKDLDDRKIVTPKEEYTFAQITETEHKAILEVFQNVQTFFDLTPRNMAVFHYRFILAKNIMQSRRKISPTDATILMKMIFITYFTKRSLSGGFPDDAFDESYKNLKTATEEDYKKYFQEKIKFQETDTNKSFQEYIDIVSPY